MADQVLQRDVAHLLTARLATAFTALTAGGAGDNTNINGIAIDRFVGGSLALNAEILLAFTATLAATKALLLKGVKIWHGDDGVNWAVDPYASIVDPGQVAVGAAGGSTEKGVFKLGVDLGSAKRFIRVDFTPDLNAANTDTGTVVAILNLAGFDRLPAA
ncbi:MAG: hypothetical protein ABS57_19755 [Mesorhizobium sp. SCN 65-12]|nr:MAG: hypothetical protein ABS57_19755 [Mesorhizobium sp. SCN 65-12]